MNSNYSYENIGMWAPETWADRDAAIRPITDYLARFLFETVRPAAKTGVFAGRTDGVYNTKVKALMLQDVLEQWNEAGLSCHLAGMGMAAWIMMAPHGAAPETPLLLVFHSADMSDPLWAMDTLEYFRAYNERAAAERFAVLYLVQNVPFGTGIFNDILLEVSALWRLDMRRVYLDLSALKAAGTALTDIPGFDPARFDAEERFSGIHVLNITDRWQSRIAHQFIVGGLNRGNPEFDYERLVHSPLGKAMADGMRMEYDYSGWDDPALLSALAEKGLKLEGHFYASERWLSAVPAQRCGKLPLLICMKEVRPASEFQSLTALQFYSHFLDIAAAGECALLLFAMESPDDNELLCGILQEAIAAYDLDPQRIYITGQSHNGYYAMEFARRHPELIAAVATLNDRHGIASPNYSIDPAPVSDAMLDAYAAWDLPLINICGQIENVFPHTEPGTPGYFNAIDAFHRRLKAFRCPDRTDAEIEAALHSADRAERANGVPADRTEIVYTMGHEAYIADFQNIDGKWHLRFVTLENLPHMISPQMAELSWSFLRRFARAADGSIIEC